MVLLEYNHADKKNIHEEETYLISFVLAIGLFVYILEFSCYIYIFIYLYKHNNRLMILSTEAKKFRNRCNAHTLMGQLFFFINEMIYIFVLLIAFSLGHNQISPTLAKDYLSVYKLLEFGIVSVFHCYLVPALRPKTEEIILNKLN
jgi:hypothetical protein